MNPPNELTELLEVLRWMETTAGISWSSVGEDVPGPVDAYSLNARGFLSNAADDLGENQLGEELCKEVFRTDTRWHEGDPQAWLSAARVINRVAWLAGRKAVGDRSADIDPEEGSAAADEAYQTACPLIDELLAEESSVEALGEDRVVGLWASSFGIAGWAQRGYNRTRALEVLQRIAEEISRRPGSAELRNAAYFAIDSALTTAAETDENVSPEKVWSRAQPAYAMSVESEGEDGWLVGAVGTLGMFITTLPAQHKPDAKELLHDVHNAWTEQCYDHHNVGWAAHNVVRALLGYSTSAHRRPLSDAERASLTKLIEVPRRAVLDSILSFPRFIESSVRRAGSDFADRLHAAVCELLRGNGLEEDAEKALQYVRALTELTDRIGGSGIGAAWSAIEGAGPVVQLAWLKNVSLVDLGAWTKDAIRQHATAVLELYRACGSALADECRDAWADAVTEVASAAFVRDDTDTIDALLTGIPNPETDEPGPWLSVVSVAALGARRERPDDVTAWASRALVVCDPARLSGSARQPAVHALTALAHETAALDPALADSLLGRVEELLTQWSTESEEDEHV